MDPPDAEGDADRDLVSRTSARLLAAGFERRERLTALHLLAVLDASTDVAGRVRRPLDDLAAEFELPVLSVIRSLEQLERVGAIERDGGAVTLLDRDANGIGGLHLADFLDDVRAALDDDIPAPRQRSRWVTRTAVGVAAAVAAIGVISLAPSTTPSVQPIAAGSSTTAVRLAQQPSVELPATPAPATGAVAAPATSGTTPATDSAVVAAGTCPSGVPSAELAGTVLRITNPSTAGMVVTAITVGGTAMRTPIDVAAGTTVTRDLSAAALAGRDVRIDTWMWSDPTVARTCPS
ncbi:MAG: hypothetical protein QOI47_740 [Actinomycetota bacterium]|nr:hypothetical protein [Actinomycetota bacterium]